MVVVHRHFDDAEAGILDLAHHLEADDAGVLLELDAIEDLAAHQTEVAVDVADAQPEQQLDGVVVDAADDDAMPRIGAADLVAGDHVGVGGQPVPEHRELGRIVLRVAVGVGNRAPWSPRRTRAQRRRRSRDCAVMNDADLGYVRASSSTMSCGGVLAAVVDDDDLVVGGQRAPATCTAWITRLAIVPPSL